MGRSLYQEGDQVPTILREIQIGENQLWTSLKAMGKQQIYGWNCYEEINRRLPRCWPLPWGSEGNLGIQFLTFELIHTALKIKSPKGWGMVETVKYLPSKHEFKPH
jgi:hypothetical protein